MAMFENKMDYKLWRSKQKQQKSAAKLKCLIGKMELRKKKSATKLELNNYRMEQRKKKCAMRINASRKAAERKWAIQRSKWA